MLRTKTKQFLTCLFVMQTCILVLANPPQTISYQGRISDEDGMLNRPVGMVFRFFHEETSGTALWQETHESINVDNGSFVAVLGKTTAFPEAVFTEQIFLEIEVSGEILSPRLPFSSVPYAMIAGKVADGGVATAAIAPEAVGKSKLGKDIAGEGLAQNADGSLRVATISADMIADGTLPATKITGTAATLDAAETLRNKALEETLHISITAKDLTGGNVLEFLSGEYRTPLFSVDINGNLSAASLSGNGTGVTGVNADTVGGIGVDDGADENSLWTSGQILQKIKDGDLANSDHQTLKNLQGGDSNTNEFFHLSGNAYLSLLEGALADGSTPWTDANSVTTGVFKIDLIPDLDADKIISGTFTPARIPDLDAVKISAGILHPNRIPDLDAAKITAGTFNVSLIPQLDAAKISSGVFAAPQIPQLDAGKIDAGVFDPARIPDLDAAKTTTGIFDPARIPDLDATKITSGVFSKASIPDLDTAKITTGVFDTNRIPNMDANKIDSGIFANSRIPDLDAGKTTTGVFDPNRIPNLDAGKITSGTFNDLLIPQLNADKVSTGTFASGLIPDLDAAKLTSGVLDPMRIPQLDATKITGTAVTLETEETLRNKILEGTQRISLTPGTLTGTKIIEFMPGRVSAAMFSVDINGNLEATTLSGDGTAVTNVDAATLGGLSVDDTLKTGSLWTSARILQAIGDGDAANKDHQSLDNLQGGNPDNSEYLHLSLADYNELQSGHLVDGSTPWTDAASVKTGVFDPNRIPNIDAGKITSGIFASAQIPDMGAEKIISGVFDARLIPDLDASKVTSGTFDAARIPQLSADKITSGELNINRIPPLRADKVTIGTFTNAQLANSTFTLALGDKLGTTNTDNIVELGGVLNLAIKVDQLAGSGLLEQSGKLVPNVDNDSIEVTAANQLAVKNVSADKITGTIPVAQIPELDASKITSGSLAPETIPIDGETVGMNATKKLEVKMVKEVPIVLQSFADTTARDLAFPAGQIARGQMILCGDELQVYNGEVWLSFYGTYYPNRTR